MEIKVIIPEEEFKRIKTLMATRKALETTYETLQTNGIVQSINAVNNDVNALLLKYVYENKEWQK